MEELQENSKVFSRFGFNHISKSVDISLQEIKNGQLGVRKVFKSKWSRLNRNLLGGLQVGKMYVIAGRPGVGKSAFSNQLIFDVLDQSDKPLIVLYWTFEMPGYQQILRSGSKLVNKEVADLLSVETPLSDMDFKTYATKIDKYRKYSIFFNNVPRDTDFILKANEEITVNYPSHTIINLIDHTRLVLSKDNEAKEMQRIDKVSKTCMLIQATIGSITIMLSQLNRNIEQEHRAKNQYQPLLSDIFGSDSVGQDAHVVAILNRPFDLYGITESYCGEDPKGLLAVHIEKNRDGLLGMIPYEADLSTFTIKER